MASPAALPLEHPRRASRARAVCFERFVVLGDSTVASSPERGPGSAELLASRVGAHAMNFAQQGATGSDVLQGQLPLALALEPTFAVVCLGITEAGGQQGAAAAGDAAFLEPILLDTELVVAELRAAGADVLLVKPLALASTPAAWLRYGGRFGPQPRGAPVPPAPLRAMGWIDRRWSRGLRALASTYDAAFVDLLCVIEALVARGGRLDGVAVGVPPQHGDPGDLFADALHLSAVGAALAAEVLSSRVRDWIATATVPSTDPRDAASGWRPRETSAERETTPRSESDGSTCTSRPKFGRRTGRIPGVSRRREEQSSRPSSE